MREMLLTMLLPLLKKVAASTKKTEIDDRGVELLEIIVASDAAWNWFLVLLQNRKPMFGAPGESAIGYTYADDAPPEVMTYLDKLSQQEGYRSFANANYGIGVVTILNLISIVRKFLAFIDSLKTDPTESVERLFQQDTTA